MAKLISIKIDVTKLDESRYFKGQKGTYLDITGILNDAPDKNGNYGFITQSVTKEEREAKLQLPILGNFKVLKEFDSKPVITPSAPAKALNGDMANQFNDSFISEDLPF